MQHAYIAAVNSAARSQRVVELSAYDLAGDEEYPLQGKRGGRYKLVNGRKVYKPGNGGAKPSAGGKKSSSGASSAAKPRTGKVVPAEKQDAPAAKEPQKIESIRERQKKTSFGDMDVWLKSSFHNRPERWSEGLQQLQRTSGMRSRGTSTLPGPAQEAANQLKIIEEGSRMMGIDNTANFLSRLTREVAQEVSSKGLPFSDFRAAAEQRLVKKGASSKFASAYLEAVEEVARLAFI